jgi:hypothetical protein
MFNGARLALPTSRHASKRRRYRWLGGALRKTGVSKVEFWLPDRVATGLPFCGSGADRKTTGSVRPED